MKLLKTEPLNIIEEDYLINDTENNMEDETIIFKTMRWKIEKAKKWFYVWWKVHIFWYNIIKENWWKKLQINDNQKEIVKRIFDMFVIWKYTLDEIKNILEKENINLWMHNWKIYTSTLERILREDTYTGMYYIWKYWKVREPIKNELLNLEVEPKYWYGLPCPKIISDDIYKWAQEIFIEDNLKYEEI